MKDPRLTGTVYLPMRKGVRIKVELTDKGLCVYRMYNRFKNPSVTSSLKLGQSFIHQPYWKQATLTNCIIDEALEILRLHFINSKRSKLRKALCQ